MMRVARQLEPNLPRQQRATPSLALPTVLTDTLFAERWRPKG